MFPPIVSRFSLSRNISRSWGLHPARSFLRYRNIRVINLQSLDAGNARVSASESSLSNEEDRHNVEISNDWKPESNDQKTSVLAKLAIALGFAATATIISLF